MCASKGAPNSPTYREWSMTWRTLWGSIQVILAVITLVGVLIAPMGIMRIEPLWIGAIAWIGWGILVAFFAIVIGLTPYRGQKEITKEHDREHEASYKNLETQLNGWRNKANELETKVAKYKQKFGEME